MKKTPKTRKRPGRRRIKKNRNRANWIEQATKRYYASLSPEDLEEENRLAVALSQTALQVNFDEDY